MNEYVPVEVSGHDAGNPNDVLDVRTRHALAKMAAEKAAWIAKHNASMEAARAAGIVDGAPF